MSRKASALADAGGAKSEVDFGFKVILRDINEDMVAAWGGEDGFGLDTFKDLVEVRPSGLCCDGSRLIA